MILRTSVMIWLAASLAAATPAAAQDVVVRGVDSLHVRLNLQGQFNSTTVDDEPATEWLVRRARVGVRAFAAGWIRAEVEADFGDGDAELTDGYLRLSFDRRARVQVGQFKKPFDALELTSSRQLLTIERDGAPRGTAGSTPHGLVSDLGYSTRDVGGSWLGSFGRVRAHAGFWNGEGENTPEDDDGKQVVARVELEIAPGWEVAGAWGGLRISDPAVEDDAEWFHAGEVAVVGGEYGAPGWKGLAQVMFGDNHDPVLGGGPEAAFIAVQAIAAYHAALYTTPYVIGVEPVVRIGWTDRDTDVDDDDATLWTAGVNLHHHPRVKTQIGVDGLSPSEGDTEVAFRVHLVMGF